MTDTWTWATVTQASPLRIKVDGDTTALDATTDNLVGSLAVDDRVRVHLHSDGIIVTGLQGGAGGALAAVESAAKDRARIERLMQATGARVAVGRRGDDYDLYQEISAGVWWKIALGYTTTSGNAHHSLEAASIGRTVLTVAAADGSFVYSATGWATSSNAGSFAGLYTKNSTTGQSFTWTTPSATMVGLRAFRATNGGYALAEVDGDVTRATLLPTAQEEVNAGRLASTALVANGGTLNPTDRLYDSYGFGPPAYDDVIPFAQGLTEATHTITLTVTGYKRTASTDVRLYLSGGVYADASTSPATAGVTNWPLATLNDTGSVYEYAITYRRDGRTLTEWVGNRHGSEVETSFTIAVDGVTRSLADGEIVTASIVQVSRTTNLSNPDNAAEVIATGSLTWSLTPQNALDVAYSIDWTVPGRVYTSYIAMYPTAGNILDKGRVCGGQDVTLTADDGSANGNTRSDSTVMWNSGGKAAVMLTVRNLGEAVGSWRDSGDRSMWIEDRLGGSVNKVYVQRVGSPQNTPVDSGVAWDVRLNYRAAWLPSASIIGD